MTCYDYRVYQSISQRSVIVPKILDPQDNNKLEVEIKIWLQWEQVIINNYLTTKRANTGQKRLKKFNKKRQRRIATNCLSTETSDEHKLIIYFLQQ